MIFFNKLALGSEIYKYKEDGTFLGKGLSPPSLPLPHRDSSILYVYVNVCFVFLDFLRLICSSPTSLLKIKSVAVES